MAKIPVPVLYTCGFQDIAGGGQRSLLLLIKNIDRSRFQPILLLPGAGEMSVQAAALGAQIRVESSPALKSWRLWRPGWFVLRTARFMREAGVRIVHSDTPDLALLTATAARLAGARPVFHARTSKKYRLDRLLQLLHAAMICVSQAAAARFAVCGDGKVFVVRNGVDLALFAPTPKAQAKAKLGLAAADPVLGYAGQIIAEKGIAAILRAFALVRRELPQARLVIAGRGPYEPAMLRLADELGLGSSAMFIGFQDQAHEVIAAFDLLLLPSRAGEGLSRVLMEAMACGVPALASDDGGNPEVVTDGEDGFIIPQDDPELYAQKALHLLRDREIYAEFSVRALAAARNKFDARHTSREIAAIYESLLSTGGPG